MCIRDRVYGVDVEDARQIPLKKYIEGCINGEEDHDINQYAETKKQFDTVLEEVIQLSLIHISVLSYMLAAKSSCQSPFFSNVMQRCV